MRRPDADEQRRLARQWTETGRELAALRRAALRNKPHDPVEIEAILDLGLLARLPSRTTSGLVEMQRWFMRARKG